MPVFRVVPSQAPSVPLSATFPALLAAAIAALSPQTARAACSFTSSTVVVCTGVDPNGFSSNTGHLDVTVLPDATVSANFAEGIRLNSNDNTITNNGTISTTDGTGIYARARNTIVNSGTISTTGLGANGILVQDPGNTIINSGTISTTGNGAYAINLADNSNTVVNSGTILTAGNGATGINASSPDSTITNSGLIQVTGSSDAIRLGSAHSTLNLQPGSVIIGGLNFTTGNALTVDNGLSVALTFNNKLPATITTSGAPFAVSGNQVAVVDPTAFSQQDEMLADLTSGIFNSIHARLTGTAASSSAGFAGMQLGAGSMMHLGSTDHQPIGIER